MRTRLLPHIVLAVFLIGLFLQGSLFVLPASAAPQRDSSTPNLKLDPPKGPRGTTIQVFVYGFTSSQTCQVQWDASPQVDIGINEFGEGNASIVVSDKYSIGWHKVTVTNCNQTSEWAQGDFEVIEPATATFTPFVPTRTPTPTVTPTKKPGQPQPCGKGTCTPTISPSPSPTLPNGGIIIYPILIPPRGPYDFPQIPPASFPPAQICSGLPANSGQRIFDFEELLPGAVNNTYTSVSAGYGLTFSNAIAESPTLGTHSGRMAVRSTEGDMGSYNTPIQMNFSAPLAMIGMYVGREAPQYDRGVVSAVLTGYGYDHDGQYRAIAVAAIDLPAAATDITRCLSIRAPQGLILRAATLEYYTQDGRSAVDRRWMDDLTVVWANTGLLVDTPPVVTIRSPLNNITVNNQSGVMLQVLVNEDVRLDRLYANVNGGSQAIPITFNHSAGGDPTRYEGSLQLTNSSGLLPNATNTIVVSAVDSNRGVGSAQVSFFWQPRPPLNIEIVKVEIIQVVQCLDNPACPDNSVPMIDDKPALVRVYAHTNGREVNNISGRLCLDSGVPNCTSNYLDSYNRVTVTNSGNPVGDFRGNLDMTINFLIPASTLARVSEPYINLYASVNYEGRDILETRYDDNSMFLRAYVEVHKTLDIGFVPMCYNRTCPINSASLPGPIMTFISHMYPTSHIRWVMYPNRVLWGTYDFNADGHGSCNDAYSSTLTSLWWFNFWTSDFSSWERYYGLVPAAANPTGNIGCGYTPGDESAGRVNDSTLYDGQIGAEEIGHNHGLNHAPSGGAANPDPGYPNTTGLLDDWGLDIYRLHLYDPATTYDFMGYRGQGSDSEWASTYSYGNLMYGLENIAEDWVYEPSSGRLAALAVHQGSAQDVLVISGIISPTGVEIAPDGVQHVSVYNPPANPQTSGPYTIQLLDAGGGTLYTSPYFGPISEDGSLTESGAFHFVLPWVEGTQVIWFNYNGGVIGGISGNDTLPWVQITDPPGDVTWPESGSAMVSWVGKDNEPLTYSVQFSADGGASWILLSSGLTEMQFEVDLASLPGTAQGKLRVVAADGFNTTSADSPGRIILPNKAPLAAITSPQDGYKVPQTYPLILEGVGTDYEDGPLSGETFSWSSDRDGALGSGESLIRYDLSVGLHTITLSVTDAQGKTGAAMVQVNIQAAPTPVVEATPDATAEVPQSGVTDTPQPAISTPAPAAGEGSSSGLLLGLVIGLGAAVVVLAVLLLRKK